MTFTPRHVACVVASDRGRKIRDHRPVHPCIHRPFFGLCRAVGPAPSAMDQRPPSNYRPPVTCCALKGPRCPFICPVARSRGYVGRACRCLVAHLHTLVVAAAATAAALPEAHIFIASERAFMARSAKNAGPIALERPWNQCPCTPETLSKTTRAGLKGCSERLL